MGDTPYSVDDPDPASGEDLDRMAVLYGVSREQGETDESIRGRIKTVIDRTNESVRRRFYDAKKCALTINGKPID